MGAGILTSITGNRADGVIWDDLIKGREQADSPQVRQKTWEAYFDDLLTRKKPNAFEIGITTRWQLTAGELSERTQLSPGATTAAIERLESAGYAVRTRDEADGQLAQHVVQEALDVGGRDLEPPDRDLPALLQRLDRVEPQFIAGAEHQN